MESKLRANYTKHEIPIISILSLFCFFLTSKPSPFFFSSPKYSLNLRNLNPTHQFSSSGFSMAASSIPTIIKPHHKLNNNAAEPIKQDPSKFYYHFLYKSLIVAVFLIILPLFPSQAPDFINQSLLSRNWELLHLLFVGIAISYGLFCRRNDGGTDKENNNNKFDTAQSYVSRFLQVSSFFEDDTENDETPSSGGGGGGDDDDDGKIQTWNNNFQYHRNEPVVVVASKRHSDSNLRISEKPLLLPVRSLKSRVVSDNPCPVQSVHESKNPTCSVPGNGSGSKSGSRRLSRNTETEGSGRPTTMEDRSKDNDNVVLASPIPWRSESLMKLQNSRMSRPNPMSSGSSLSSPKKKEQSLSSSESGAKNSEDTVKNMKGFYKSSNIPLPPPPPPPMLFKSISMKPRSSSLNNQPVSSDKEIKRSFTTSERKDKPIRGLYFENNNEAEEEEEQGKRKGSVRFAEEGKVMMAFEEEEDTETEDEGGEDEAGGRRIAENGANNNDDEENSKTGEGSGCSSSSAGEEGPDVDKKADEFIAKFREQIRLQRIDSIKRSANRMARNSSSR